MIEKIIEILMYTIPSIVTGLVAYYFFSYQFKKEENRENFKLVREDKKQMFSMRIKAYERMTLFMERINPSKLLVRVTPTSEDKEMYVQKLVQSVEQEFEHNLPQQIYISEECWSVLVTSKNATTHIIKKTAEDSRITNAQQLREGILKRMVEGNPPSTTGITFIREEVKEMF
jgi:hypothetical protein